MEQCMKELFEQREIIVVFKVQCYVTDFVGEIVSDLFMI